MITKKETQLWRADEFLKSIEFKCDKGHEFLIPNDPGYQTPNDKTDLVELQKDACPQCARDAKG